jgi:hypothetical protein
MEKMQNLYTFLVCLKRLIQLYVLDLRRTMQLS